MHTTVKFDYEVCTTKGYTAAQIADVAEMDEKQIKDIIKNAELLTV